MNGNGFGAVKLVNQGDPFLTEVPGGFFSKIGYTDAAQHTYVAATKRDGRRLGVVFLRAQRWPLDQWQQAAKLFDWGYALPAGDAGRRASSTRPTSGPHRRTRRPRPGRGPPRPLPPAAGPARARGREWHRRVTFRAAARRLRGRGHPAGARRALRAVERTRRCPPMVAPRPAHRPGPTLVLVGGRPSRPRSTAGTATPARSRSAPPAGSRTGPASGCASSCAIVYVPTSFRTSNPTEARTTPRTATGRATVSRGSCTSTHQKINRSPMQAQHDAAGRDHERDAGHVIEAEAAQDLIGDRGADDGQPDRDEHAETEAGQDGQVAQLARQELLFPGLQRRPPRRSPGAGCRPSRAPSAARRRDRSGRCPSDC